MLHIRTIALAGAALVAGLAIGGAARAENITLFTFETLGEPQLFTEYKAKFNEAPEVKIFADEDEAFASMRAGYAPDVMGPCSYEFERWREAGLLQPIDVTKLKYWNEIAPMLKNIPGAMKSETEAWFVPQYWASTSITYRTDLAPEYAANERWDILWDPKYKGRISALEGVDDTVALTAKHLGIDIYKPLSAEDRAKLEDALRKLVANSRMIATDQTAISNGLKSGELVAAVTWSDSWAALKNEGVPVAFMNPPAGRFTYVCGFTVHKDAKDWERIYSLIDSGLNRAAAEFLVAGFSNGSANAKVMSELPQEMLDAAGLPRDVDAFLKTGTLQVRIPDKEALINSWAEIRAGL